MRPPKANAADLGGVPRYGKQDFFDFNDAPRQDGLFEFCSGIGAYYTTRPDAKDPKTHYLKITLPEILAKVKNPPRVAKDQAQWVVFSKLMSRVHPEQRECGLFGCLWADIDKVNGLPWNDVVKRVQGITSDFILYTSFSAKENCPKCRVIVPLEKQIDGQTFCILQKIINDKLEAAGLPPDRATERAGQLCYLPNRGQFYQYEIQDLCGPVDAETFYQKELTSERERIRAEEKAHAERMEQARLKAAERMANGTESPVEAFNAAYPLEDVLMQYGYVRRGDRFISPNSESGKPGVSITSDRQKWLSAHTSDAGIGTPTKNGTMGDAFDLYVYYEHGGDFTEAIKAAGEMFNCNCFSKDDQREYMESKDREETYHAFDDLGKDQTENPKTKTFSLDNFILNGTSTKMKTQMMFDEYVLDRMAISGQATVFYGKANAGKTLLTIKNIILAIKHGQLKGNNVYYINADDTFKGLTYKLELAEQEGFNMLAPGHPPENPFKHEHIVHVLQSEGAHKRIIILDTVKKFTDLMSKKDCSKFGNDVRSFVSRGGTVIMLAHVNKYNDADDKPIYSGTTDLVDDCDCAYTINILKEDAFNGIRTVIFENFKNRGDVALDVTFQYDFRPETSYFQKIDSVQRISKEQHKNMMQQQAREKVYLKNREAVEAIKTFLLDGEKKQTEIVKELSDNHGVSRRQAINALNDHTGDDAFLFYFWNYTTGDKNAKIYHLVL